MTASNTTFGCNPYIQNIDVMKNKDVELIRRVRVRKRERERERNIIQLVNQAQLKHYMTIYMFIIIVKKSKHINLMMINMQV